MYYKRWIHNKLVSEVSQNKVRIIFGARQVGKTYLLNNMFPKEKVLVYNLQDTSLRRRLEKDPGQFSRELNALDNQIKIVLIDEIQKVPTLLDEIQFIYDQDKYRFQFYLTGSSARKLRKHSANLLPGRSHLYNLFPVSSFEEENRTSHLFNIHPDEKLFFPQHSLEEKLIFGNLPGVREESEDSAYETLSAYVINYLEEEIRNEALIKNTISFEIFLQLAALESSKQINLTKISQESGIPISSIKNYYQVLVDTFIGYWVPAYKKSTRKRLLTTPEFLFFDIGVRNAAAELRITKDILPTLGGYLFEHLTGLELIQRAEYSGRGYSVSFWRTVSGAEVDFIFETPEEDIPIEVKWTDTPSARYAKNIEKFIDLHSERSKRGFVVCRIPRAQQLTERVKAIPLTDL